MDCMVRCRLFPSGVAACRVPMVSIIPVNTVVGLGLGWLRDFLEELFEYGVKFLGYFHHRGVPALVYDVELGVFDKSVKFFADEGGGYHIVGTPDEECG